MRSERAQMRNGRYQEETQVVVTYVDLCLNRLLKIRLSQDDDFRRVVRGLYSLRRHAVEPMHSYTGIFSSEAFETTRTYAKKIDPKLFAETETEGPIKNALDRLLYAK